MTISIPDGLWAKYYEAADFFLDDDHIGRRCKVVYPPKRIECVNCTTGMVGSSVANFYKHGGPAPFQFGSCPVCGGSGFSEQESTDTLRLRIYWTKKDMARIAPYVDAGTLKVADGVVLVIGYMSDLTKLKQAAEVILIDEQTHEDFRFQLYSEPYPHGFGKNRYFAAYLKRT